MTFPGILFQLCSGTKVFPDLIKLPLWRVFLHLILMLILCTVAVGAASAFSNRRTVRDIADRFFERTGEIELLPDSIKLEKLPELSRAYTAGKFRFNYFAAAADFTPDAMKKADAPFSIFCFPSGMAFCFHDPNEPDSGLSFMSILPAKVLYSVFASNKIDPNDLTMILQNNDNRYSQNAMYDKIRQELIAGKSSAAESASAGGKNHPFYLNAADLTVRILSVLVFAAVLAFFMEMAMQLLLAVVCFSLAQKFRGSALPKKVPYKSLLITAVYATFPAILIAALFQMINLHFVSFTIVFFIVFFVYQIFAFNAVFRHFNPMEDMRSRNDDDGTDF